MLNEGAELGPRPHLRLCSADRGRLSILRRVAWDQIPLDGIAERAMHPPVDVLHRLVVSRSSHHDVGNRFKPLFANSAGPTTAAMRRASFRDRLCSDAVFPRSCLVQAGSHGLDKEGPNRTVSVPIEPLSNTIHEDPTELLSFPPEHRIELQTCRGEVARVRSNKIETVKCHRVDDVVASQYVAWCSTVCYLCDHVDGIAGPQYAVGARCLSPQPSKGWAAAGPLQRFYV